MPIYEYACYECKEVREFIVPVAQSGDARLCFCKDETVKMERVISQSSFHLKGSGWARDNYQK